MDIANVTVGLAFLAGLASFLSPCVFSLVPAYIGYLGGRAVGGEVEFIAIEGVYHNWTPQMEAPEGGDRERDLGPLALPFFQKHLLA